MLSAMIWGISRWEAQKHKEPPTDRRAAKHTVADGSLQSMGIRLTRVLRTGFAVPREENSRSFTMKLWI